MVKLYVMMIHRGDITTEDVPAIWKEKVIAALNEDKD